MSTIRSFTVLARDLAVRLAGGVVAVAGVMGVAGVANAQSVSLAGRAYASVAGSSDFVLQQFSVVAWIHPTGAGENGGGTILTAGQHPGQGTFLCSYWTGWGSDGRLSGMVVHQYSVLGTVVTSQATVPIGQTGHMALTFDGTTLRLYVNGVLDQAVPYGFSGVEFVGVPEINLGAFQQGSGYTFNRFDGQLDDVALWGRALSAGEVASLAGCGSPVRVGGLVAYYPFSGSSLVDASGHAHHASAQGAVTFGPDLSTRCPVDLDDGSGAGTCDGGVDVNDLLYFLTQYEAGDAAVDLDDGSGSGTADGGVDINDLLFFLAHYEAGC